MPQLDIDIIIEESLAFNDLAENQTQIEAWGIKLPVISIDDLIEMKRKANRDKDKLDIARLLELKNIQWSNFNNLKKNT